jgi:UDP-N-acetylglucosamine 1-carboxyvinyltransferase
MMSEKFIIQGGIRLSGEYRVQGNKNAALPLLAAGLLAPSGVVFTNVPVIVDVENLLQLLSIVGLDVDRRGSSIALSPAKTGGMELPGSLVEKLRGGVLLLGPLAALRGSVRTRLPGGCPIGKRSFETHWAVFRAAGFRVAVDAGSVSIERVEQVSEPYVYLEEASVTATENALLLFAALGSGVVENPAREPHVFSLIDFLQEMGCEIEVHPLYYKVKRGVDPGLPELTFHVPGDYIDAGTVAIASAATQGSVTLRGVGNRELLGIRPVLKHFGIHLEQLEKELWRVRTGELKCPDQVTAGPWPLFPTDLVSLAIVLATQSKGLCLVHDWMYEARMFFVDKLVRMGARITMCDPHRVLVEGGARLRGVRLESPDIRAGMALVVAGLCAEGTTTIEHAEVIQRGYESVTDRLGEVGARISQQQRQGVPQVP